mgnify:CR=1 FL=1
MSDDRRAPGLPPMRVMWTPEVMPYGELAFYWNGKIIRWASEIAGNGWATTGHVVAADASGSFVAFQHWNASADEKGEAVAFARRK